jgi:hypothetical protein
MIRETVLRRNVFWNIAIISSIMHSPAFAAKSVDESPGRMTWGAGDHYKLPTDPDGWSIVEPGKMHRKIYAAADGTRDNSGHSPDDPVDLKTGCRMIRSGSSDWLLLRRGDTFEQGVSLGENMLGESPLTPIYIGAYGEGPRPILEGVGAIKNYPRRNVVIRDLHLHGKGLRLLGSGKLENLLFENLLMDNASGAVITPRRVTIRRCVIKNCHIESPPNPKNKPDNGWAREPLRNRHQGLFANSVRGLLVEENVLDHNGWEDGYVESGGGPNDPQPPSMYSHNLYLSTENRDLTVRSNINARAASQALRDGSGQFYVGNVMIANNIGGYSGPAGGDGNYTTFADNVLIHPAAKRGPKIGGRGWGWSMKDVKGSQAIRNIFAHAPEGQNNEGLKLTDGVLVEQYVRYQWHDHEDLNPTGQAFPEPHRTIMTYDRDLGSGKGTLEAFLAEATAQEKGNWHHQYTAEALVEYFQEGFGIWPGRRTEPTTVVFTAEGGDRVRWDNWRNWSIDDLPFNGDTVRLDGHEVYYSGTLDLKTLDLGSGGLLRIHQGRLTLDGHQGLTAAAEGGSVHLNRSGYLILDGLSGDCRIDFFVADGRLENRGDMDAEAKLQIEACGGELRLAGGGNTVRLGGESKLKLSGQSVQAGYYGNAPGTIRFDGNATLNFSCDENGVATLGEIGTDEMDSTLVIEGNDTLLEVDLSRLRLSAGEHRLVLVKVDRLEGRFAKEQVIGVPNTTVPEAEIVYDANAGEIRVHLTCSTR